MRVVVNKRVAAFAMGGQQRVTVEILNRLQGVEAIAPAQPLAGLAGHLWEQSILPWKARGCVLWSPSATGPLLHGRQVVTLHDVAFLDVPEFFAPNFVRLYRTLMPLLARRAARVVTVSQFSRQRIAATLGISAAKVDVVANGVSAQFHRHSPDEIARTRAALDLPARYILLQATSDRRKNLARTLAAWRQVCGSLPAEISLVVSGNLGRAHVFGGEAFDINTPRTRALGFVDDQHMGPLMSGAEAFLFPTLYEGFGLPIIEAMACGTPVLTSAATATQEVAGDHALLVDPASEASIGQGILTLCTDPSLRERLAGEGIAHASRFSWDDAARAYERIFAAVAGEPG
jgi:glycosyltransferase involved in cell wall biosynthesis